MTSRDFCFWLQGFFEVSKAKTLGDEQTEIVKRHLSMVFKHEIDPSFPNQEALNNIHHNKPECFNLNPDTTLIRC